jgi:hypothetical protein
MQYLDISMAREFKNIVTISTSDWIKERSEESLDDFESLNIPGEEQYIIRKPPKIDIVRKNKKEEFLVCTKELTPFTYMYFGPSGVMFERECDNIATCTKNPQLTAIIDKLYQLINLLV